MQPRKCAFDDPAATVAPQGSAILWRGPRPSRAMRSDQLRPAPGEYLPQGVAVISLVTDQTRKAGTRYADIVQHRLQEPGFSRRSAVDVQSQRRALAVGDQHHLRAFAPAGRPDLVAPPFAEANVASTKHSVTFKRRRRSNRRNSFRQIPSQTPNCSYSTSRRQQVAGLGYDGGKSRHRAPVLSTQRIPSRAARSSAQGRPPFGPPRSLGNKGAICRHCRSVNIRSFRAMRSPSRRTIAHVKGLSNSKIGL